MAGNRTLGKAKAAKNDEFYTQYADIEREVNAYLAFDPDVFRGKSVLLPCDDPAWSNFTRYFAQNFERLGLRRLVSTGYAVRRKRDLGLLPGFGEEEDGDEALEHGTIFTLDGDANGNGVVDIDDLRGRPLKGDGDFRSAEVKALRDEADVIVTNPPFSLFREFIAWIMEAGENKQTDLLAPDGAREPARPAVGLYRKGGVSRVSGEQIRLSDKRFLVIGNINSVSHKEIFPLVKEGRIWLGAGFSNGDAYFGLPDAARTDYSKGVFDADSGVVKFRNCCWYTNLDHGRRHEPLQCMTMADNLRYNRHRDFRETGYVRYENFDAIEVPFVDAIPSDWDGVMGVPRSFLERFNPEQFEIVGIAEGESGKALGLAPVPKALKKQNPSLRDGQLYYIDRDGKPAKPYARILIRRKK